MSQVKNCALAGVVILAFFCSHWIRPLTAPETCMSLIMPPISVANRMSFTFQALDTTPISLSKDIPRPVRGLPPARMMQPLKIPTNIPTKIFFVARQTTIVRIVGIRMIQD